MYSQTMTWKINTQQIPVYGCYIGALVYHSVPACRKQPQFKINHNTQYMVKNFGAIWMDNWWVVFFIFHVIARTIVIILGSLVRITFFGRTLRLNIRITTRSLRIFCNLGLQLLNLPESLNQELMNFFCLGQRVKNVSTCICINKLYTTTRSRKWFE